MSDLQLGVLCIGIAVVAMVLAYNKWQELQFKQRAERDFRSRHSDVLFGGAKEAKLDTEASDFATTQSRIEPVLSNAEASKPSISTVSPEELPTPDMPSDSRLSERIDFIVDIKITASIHGSTMISAAVEHLTSSPKPVRIEGVPENSDEWHSVEHDHQYSRLRAGIQLVDRRGRIGRSDLQAFVDVVDRVAQAVGGNAEARELDKAMARADTLDSFCGEVDIQVAVHIAGARFPGTKIRALSEAAGFALDNDGRFRRRDPEGRVLVELANDEATAFNAESLRNLVSSSISLELDVPRAPGGGAAFDQFRDLARQLATALEADIVDDRRTKLSDASFAEIGKQLSAVRETMDTHGIPAGGSLALRLFS